MAITTKIYADYVEQEALSQFYEACKQPSVLQVALMPDCHAGYVLPIGAVVKTQNTIFPSFVGYDIGCGMCSSLLDIKNITTEQLQEVQRRIIGEIPLGNSKHLKPNRLVFKDKSTPFGTSVYESTGIYQLGTLGGGNHFIELGTNQDGFLAITIHSGSRGLGKKIAEHYMRRAAIVCTDEALYATEFDNSTNGKQIKLHNPTAYDKLKQEFVYRRVRARLNTNIEGFFSFDINSDEGKDYIKDMDFALDFALQNRKSMLFTVVSIISSVLNQSITSSRFINRNHNHAEVFPDGTVIHRKGATHADKGMLGVIPGNMRDGCFIVKGKGNSESMCSSSHGAGRVLSRSKAKATLSVTDFHTAMQGIVTNHTNETIDEAPDAYKDIFEVMKQQEDLVEVVDYIKPILNIKG